MKIGLTVSLLIVLSTVLFAGGDGESPESETGFTIWSRSNEKAHAQWAKVMNAFTESSGIPVDYPLVDNTDFENMVARAAAGGSLPDALINDTAQLGNLRRQRIIAPVDRSRIVTADEIIETAWKAAEGSDGQYWGVPVNTQAFLLFIRSAWRENLNRGIPESFDELVDLALAFRNDDPDGNGEKDTYGFVVPGTTQRGYASWFWQSFLWSYGGDYMKPAGDGRFRAALNESEALSALEWLKDLFYTHDVVQPNAVNARTGDAHPSFISGESGIYFTGPYMIANFDENVGREYYEVVPLPPGPGGNHVMAEGENLYIVDGAKNIDDIYAFASYVTSEEGQIIGMKTDPNTNSVIRLSINANVDVSSVYDDPYWGVVEQVFKRGGRYVQGVPNWAPFRLAMAEFVNEALASPDSDVKAILDRANAEVERLLAEQGVLAP